MLVDLYFNEFGDYTLFLIIGIGFIFGLISPIENMSNQKLTRMISWFSALISGFLAFTIGEFSSSGVGGWMQRITGFALMWVAFGIVLTLGVLVGSSFRKNNRRK
jgi:high-affinity Fe2+/Pb2+ permease